MYRQNVVNIANGYVYGKKSYNVIMDMNMVGERILLSRRRMMNQEDLGKLVGLSQGRISEYERGDAKSIDLDTLTQIARALGVSPQYLAGWTDDPLYQVSDEEPPMLTDSKAVYRTDPVLSEITRLIEEMDEAKRLQMVGFARVLLHPPRIIGESE